MADNNSVIGVATMSLKDVNEDYGISQYISNIGCSIVAVADGLGSYSHSEKASRFVCEKLIEILERMAENQKFMLEHLFEGISLEVNSYVKEEFKDCSRENSDFFGTTFLCCVEKEEEMQIGYIGNGGIFHLRGNFNIFPNTQYLPWNAINLLNPHTVPFEGKNALYKLFKPNGKREEFSPTVLNISKDDLLFGDIIIICSDGIYSYDEVSIGKDNRGNIWISGEESIRLLFEHLSLFFQQENLSNEGLNNCLSDFLEELKSKKLITDDVTVAVIISSQAIKYQRQKSERINKKGDGSVNNS